MQRRFEHLTAFCSECDPSLAADLASLPPESRSKIVQTVRRLIEFHARANGITLPSEREKPSRTNIVLLRLPHTQKGV
jgi:hypothetical protein